jgi:hypothetical protein
MELEIYAIEIWHKTAVRYLLGFLIDLSLQLYSHTGVDSTSNRSWYQESSWGQMAVGT